MLAELKLIIKFRFEWRRKTTSQTASHHMFNCKILFIYYNSTGFMIFNQIVLMQFDLFLLKAF